MKVNTLFTILFICNFLLAADRVDPKEFISNFQRLDWNTAPGDAKYLRIMIEATNSQNGIEVGTYNGYGTIHMAMGYKRTGGHLTTLEINNYYAQVAQENLDKTGLSEYVTIVVGDALQTIAQLENKFDFIFIDGEKEQYYDYFILLEPFMAPHCLIIADNAIRREKAMENFLGYMKQKKDDYDMTIIRSSDLKNDGVAVIVKLNTGQN